MNARGITLGLFFALGGVAGADGGKIDAHYRLDSGWRAALNGVKRQLAAAPKGSEFVYLSGPISSGGAGNAAANLKAGQDAATKLRNAGLHVISPFELEATTRLSGRPIKHATFMRIWSSVLADPRVKRVVLMPGAESSVGATQEIALFEKRGGAIAEYHADANATGFHLTPREYDPVLGRVEHTVLTPGFSAADTESEARWAGQHGVRAMVVRPENAELAARSVHGTPTIPASVIGFPLAKFKTLAEYPRVATTTKIDDAKQALDGMKRGGAKVGELDMILDVHALKEGRYADVEKDINDVVAASSQHGKAIGVNAHVKVIVETSLLTPNEVKMAAAIVRNTDALAIKTSTGYGPRGASLGDLRIINKVIDGTKMVKVSGGVSPENFAKFSQHGDVFGMSKTHGLVDGPQAPSSGKPAQGY